MSDLRGWNAQREQTHCKNGHLLSGDNLYVRPGSGCRTCRTCQRERSRIYARKVQGNHLPGDTE